MNLDTQNLPPEVAAYIRSLEQEKQRLEQRKQQLERLQFNVFGAGMSQNHYKNCYFAKFLILVQILTDAPVHLRLLATGCFISPYGR